jgi:hypothetical protein
MCLASMTSVPDRSASTHRHVDVAEHPALLAPLPAHGAQLGEAPLVALAAGGDAVAQPVELHGDLAVELVALALLLLQDFVAPGLEGGEALIEPACDAAVEPDGGARQAFEETAVVADEHERRAHGLELALQPFDGWQVEVVGRLVEKQDVRLRRQHARQRGAAGLPAREVRRRLLAREAELLEEIACPIGVVPRREPRLHVGECRGKGRQVRLLRQIADRRRGLDKALAPVLLHQTGGDLEQRRLARAVAAHEAEPLPLSDAELGARQERRAAEGQVDVGQLQEGRSHDPRMLFTREPSPAI